MRRGLIVGCSALVIALTNATPAFADPISSATHSGQCVGLFSAQITHNGFIVRNQAHSPIGREGYVDLAQACIPA